MLKVNFIGGLCIALLLHACSGDKTGQASQQNNEPVQKNNDSLVEPTSNANDSAAIVRTSEVEDDGMDPVEEYEMEDDGMDPVNLNTTKLRAYLNDENGPTNVRESPGGEVIEMLQSQEEAIEVDIIYENEGWFGVTKAYGEEGEYSIPNGLGYIHGSVLAMDTRNYGGEKLVFYKLNSKNSEISFSVTREIQLSLLSANGEWVKVSWDDNGKKKIGWIKSEWLCGSARTNCS